jgi:integrase
MFEADDIRIMLDYAGPVMHAMLLLGVNAGFGCADAGRLPISAIDFEAGWITFPRPKTGTNRRVPLWPETIKALREALELRPNPASDEYADLVFLTRWGRSFFKDSTRYLTEQFRKFLQSIDQQRQTKAKRDKIEPPEKLYRRGRGFYTLRHVFETIGGESCDQVAVDAIMGHERGEMASIYRERISDDRLQAVVNHVRAWLFDMAGDGSDQGEADDDRQDDKPRLRVVC